MSTDLRGLLRDLAEEAPPIGNRLALADTSYAAGLRRRRLRRLEITSSAAAVVLLTLFAGLFLGSAPLAAGYGSSSGTSVSGYPTHVGFQLAVTDVPRKPGPAAGLMLGSAARWYLLSPNGHRWAIPSPGQDVQTRPILSSDGRMLGYPDASGHFVVHDLVSGTFAWFAGFSPNGEPSDGRYAIDYNLPGYFSPHDDALALPGGVDGGGGGVVVLSLASHRVSAWKPTPYTGDFMTGWIDDSRIALIDRTTTPWLLDVRDAQGHKVGGTRLSGSNPAQTGGVEGWDELTADRASLDVVAGQTQDLDWLISRYDTRDGHLLTTFMQQQPVMNCGRASTAQGVVASAWSGQALSVHESSLSGAGHRLTTVSRSLHPQCVELAEAAAGGTPRSPLLLDRVSDLARTHWRWGFVVAFTLISSRLLTRQRRLRRRS